VRRLTDAGLDPGRPSIDPLRPLLYYTQGSAVHRLHLDTLDDAVVYTHPTPPGGTFLLMDISGDGQYLGFMEIGPYEKAQDNAADFVRRYEARPLSSFWIATADGARVWKAHQEKRHLQHLLSNTLYHPHPAFSPDGRLVVFCRRDERGHNDVCLVETQREAALP
jgi:hypothetical protein